MLKIDKELEDLLLERVKTLLIQGKSRQSVKKKRTRKFIYTRTPDGDFELVGKEHTYSEDENTFLDGVPNQIIDILFQSLGIENAIQLLEKNGYLVIDPTLVSEDSNEAEGLSENAVNLIKTKILGVE
jgi:hypothetical protein